MNDRRRAPHPLSVLHILGMLALLGWWGWYFWQHSPAREAMRRSPGRAAAHHAAAALDLRGGAGANIEAGMARAGDLPGFFGPVDPREQPLRSG